MRNCLRQPDRPRLDAPGFRTYCLRKLAYPGGMIMGKDKATCDIDPVCNMDLSGREGKIGYDFEDETYYFCSELCKDHFVKEPKKYAKKVK
jgi:YHS domain-containing protein